MQSEGDAIISLPIIEEMSDEYQESTDSNTSTERLLLMSVALKVLNSKSSIQAGKMELSEKNNKKMHIN